jgi:hypothetical protein
MKGVRWALSLWVTAIVLGVSASPSLGAVNQHTAITINGNAGFAACKCATGNGSAANPWVIGPYAITTETGTGSAVTVENVTADFTVTGISANYSDPNPQDAVIDLSGDHPTDSGTVSNISANAEGMGVQIASSSNIVLNGVSVNKMFGAGVSISNSTNITSLNGKYKATSDEVPMHDADGLYALNSSNIQIGGVPGCPVSGACNSFDYDSGYGVYLQNTNYVTIDNASANADDTGGYILDNASNVTIENSTAEAGGPICISLNGGKEPSGYFDTPLMGNIMLINLSKDNTLVNDTFNGFAPANGFDIAGTPNTFYSNVCTGAITTFPAGTSMGTPNTFSNLCYTTSNDVADLPPSTCKS